VHFLSPLYILILRDVTHLEVIFFGPDKKLTPVAQAGAGSYKMSANVNFNVILTRNANSVDDERISVYPVNRDFYQIVYSDNQSGRNWQFDTDYAGLCKYFETLTNSLKYDIIDRYFDVQIQFPMYPALAMPVPTFCSAEFQKTFAEMFDSVMSMEIA
jgi:hypothetical protein